MRAWAERYAEIGMVLTWVPPGCKGPRHRGWNQECNWIRGDAVREHWTLHPFHGIAALLAPSGLVSLDVDDLEGSRLILGQLGVDLDQLDAPRIESRPGRWRMMFKATAETLHHHSAAWPLRDNPRQRRVIFELRAGVIADTLPPTIHPDTGAPYRWAVTPKDGFPDLPPALLDLWANWSDRRILDLCPWAPPPPPPIKRARRSELPSVIAAFNDTYAAGDILAAHGYEQCGRRFSKPGSSHDAGVVLLDSGKVYSHHVGDPLGDGRAHDAFDVWCLLEYDGDTRTAVKAAAHLLGLEQRAA